MIKDLGQTDKKYNRVGGKEIKKKLGRTERENRRERERVGTE